MVDRSSSEWDDEYRVPVLSWPSGAPPEILPEQDMLMVAEPEEDGLLARRMLYKPADSKTLIVSLHGALNRGKYRTPRFEWRRTLSRIDCAQLYLSDSTLEINNTLEIGWYIGTAEQDLLSEYATLVRSICIGGDYTRVICVGSSAGGFAALALSRQVPNSVAVVFSPQTSIAAYHPLHRKALSAASFKKYSSFGDIELEFGNRVNMRKLYKASEDRNYVHYVQNTRDRFHFEAHYVPFALSFGVDPERGGHAVGRRISFNLERQGEGHSPPSRGSFVRHLEQAHQQYFGVSLRTSPADSLREQELGGL